MHRLQPVLSETKPERRSSRAGFESLDEFRRELDAIVARHRDDGAAIVAQAKPHVERLVADPSWIVPQLYERVFTGYGRRLLYRDPSGVYGIWSGRFAPGRRTSVHDHGGWGLVGVWQGEEHEERFERVDDATRDGYALLEPVGTSVNTPGCVSVLLPPSDIHRVSNPTGEPAYSIHIYGWPPDGPTYRFYDLDTGAIQTWTPGTVAVATWLAGGLLGARPGG